MHRRDFCKLLAIAAASKAVPSSGQTCAGEPAWIAEWVQSVHAGLCSVLRVAAGEESLLQGERRTRSSRNGSMKPTWQPPAWNYNPVAQSVAGGLWDDVPLQSPIPDLAGDGPFKPTWDSLLEYEAPDWYQDAKFGIWAHWSPQCVAEAGDWYARNMYIEDQRQYKYQLEHYRSAIAVRIQGSLRAVDAAELGSGRVDHALQKCRRKNLRRAGQSP